MPRASLAKVPLATRRAPVMRGRRATRFAGTRRRACALAGAGCRLSASARAQRAIGRGAREPQQRNVVALARVARPARVHDHLADAVERERAALGVPNPTRRAASGCTGRSGSSVSVTQCAAVMNQHALSVPPHSPRPPGPRSMSRNPWAGRAPRRQRAADDPGSCCGAAAAAAQAPASAGAPARTSAIQRRRTVTQCSR